MIPTDGGWEVRRAETRPDVRVDVVAGEVTRSLFEAVEQAGGAAQLAVDLAEIFESDFDFTADTRAGDRFRLLVETRFANDTFVDYGRILVAQYASDGRVLTGVRFERAADGRRAFYDPDGRSLWSNAGDARLATAGTGDVLSGVIGALLAQGLDPLHAAGLGAFVHGTAGRLGPRFVARPDTRLAFTHLRLPSRRGSRSGDAWCARR